MTFCKSFCHVEVKVIYLDVLVTVVAQAPFLL